jgi:tetratricopeptide (TPR) repeat protein
MIRNTFLALIFASMAFAQGNVEKMIIEGKEQFKVASNTYEDEAFIKARSLFERLLMQDQKLDLIHYYIGFADYRLATKYFENNQEKAGQYLDDGIAHLEKAIQLNDKLADAQALVSSLYGQKIGLDPAQAMILGPKTWTAMGAAKKSSPDNPRVLMLQAISTYYSPEQYGGSKAKGAEDMEKAIAAFRQEKLEDPLLPDWGFEDALMMMANWQLEQGQKEEAKKLVTETLQVNPDFGWAIMMQDSLGR